MTITIETSRRPGAFRTAMAFAAAYWRRHPWCIGSALFFSLLLAGTNIGLPLAVDFVSRVLIEGRDAPVFFLAAIAIIVPPLMLGRDLLWAGACWRIMEEAARDGFDHVQRMDSSWHAERPAGAILKDITRGVDALESLSDRIIYTFLPLTLIGSGSAALQIWRSGWAGAAFALSIATVIALVVWHSTKIVMPRYSAAATQDSIFAGQLADAIAGNAVVRAFACETAESDGVNKATRIWLTTLTRAWRGSIDQAAIQQTLMVVALLAPIAITLHDATPGGDIVGRVAFLATAWLSLRSYVLGLGTELRNMLKAASDLAALSALSEAKPTV